MASITDSTGILCELRGAEVIPVETLHTALNKRNDSYIIINTEEDKIQKSTHAQDPKIAELDVSSVPLREQLESQTSLKNPQDTLFERNVYLFYSVVSGILIVLFLVIGVFFIDKKNQGM